MDDDVNQLDLQAQEDNFSMSELSSFPYYDHGSRSPAEEIPVNQSSMLCNDQAGQKTLVDNDVINDSIQQTTQFPPSFPQTMVTTLTLFISSAEIMGVWYGFWGICFVFISFLINFVPLLNPVGLYLERGLKKKEDEFRTDFADLFYPVLLNQGCSLLEGDSHITFIFTINTETSRIIEDQKIVDAG
ncbi:hypothetical protein SADUNF_Sadunf19G0007400 [Salix dunnii]|uniref:Uncharacterized protein n=1 Tax=Salix dunnii TaxID=1413687 RepID=A0A835J169_9ROSI|nr:hypothetical protein SADUNF_Sadunf19G0007400 [Salix dunnii]